MNPSLMFVVPVHGRLELAAICLRQLERTCRALTEDGLEASAVVIADRENLRELRRRVGELIGIPKTQTAGTFAAVERENRWLSQRFNDGIQAACDPAWNPRPADYVVPCGSDDWVDHRILLQLPQTNRTVVGFQRMSFVHEDGSRISSSFVSYAGGCGIRIYPRDLVRRLGYRPADEDRRSGCDTSILANVLSAVRNVRIVHADVHERQIVDWKTEGANLNSYRAVSIHHSGPEADPWEALAGIYPAEALSEMREHYGR